MEPSLILLIIFFIVVPLLEKVIKAGRQQQQPPQRQPRPTPRPSGQVPRPTSQRSDEDDAAAGMLPDDLWEILTGEKRPPRQIEPADEEEEWELDPQDPSTWTPPRSQEPEPARQTLPGRTERQEAPAWTDPTWRPTPPQRRETTVPATFEDELPEEAYTRTIPARVAPRIESLEQLEIDDEVRHDAFHERLLRAERGAVAVRSTSRPAVDELFGTGADLRRAIIMAEVLGPPKALE